MQNSPAAREAIAAALTRPFLPDSDEALFSHTSVSVTDSRSGSVFFTTCSIPCTALDLELLSAARAARYMRRSVSFSRTCLARPLSLSA